MSTLQIVSFVFAVLTIIDAIYVGFFSGEKHMMWYLRSIGDWKKYDLKKFKIVHACITMGVAACFLACGFLEKGYIAILFISVLVGVQQILFNKVCKK